LQSLQYDRDGGRHTHFYNGFDRDEMCGGLY
jgi:hypothetical protein